MADEADHVGETIEKLTELHRLHQARSTPAQRIANRVTRALGRPTVIATALLAIVAWILGNLSAPQLHLQAFDPITFPELELVLGVVAVLVALLILSTQQHGEELAQRRAELTLQIALLSERKVAKVIGLLEEQRAQNPLLPSRHDPEAETMAQAVDTSEALERLEAARPALD